MKKLLMLSAVVMAALFASCDDEEIDYSASYPLKVARFYEVDGGDMILFRPQRAVLTYHFKWNDSATINTNSGELKYEYKEPYFFLTDTITEDWRLQRVPVSIQIKDSVHLESTYHDGSVKQFYGEPTDYWWEMGLY